MLKNHAFSLALLLSMGVGSLLGLVLGKNATLVKPLGDIFLNLLFTAVVPVVFFSISSAVASISEIRRLFKILAWMLAVFTATGIVACSLMIVAVRVVPPASQVSAPRPPGGPVEQIRPGEQVVKALTVSDLPELLSKKNMLALILMALLLGLAASQAGEKGRAFTEFLVSGNEVILKLVDLVMWFAPVGLCACFAHLVGVFGPELLGVYARSMAVYYPVALAYFFVGFTAYACLAGRCAGARLFWQEMVPPSLTALATGSSMATLPSNLVAAARIGVPRDIREVILPIGATIHMDGTCLSAILKIALIHGLLGLEFSGAGVAAKAIGVALLGGMVTSGIPGGAFVGEMVIVTLYGFPAWTLPIISMIGQLVDPVSTMLNATGDTVAGMMVARILGGRGWLDRPGS